MYNITLAELSIFISFSYIYKKILVYIRIHLISIQFDENALKTSTIYSSQLLPSLIPEYHEKKNI